MRTLTLMRIVGSIGVIAAYFIILHVNVLTGVIINFIADLISIPYFAKTKSLGCGNYVIIPTGNFNVKTGTMNITQAMTLLLLSKCLVHPHLGLCFILFITDPKNKIGYDS